MKTHPLLEILKTMLVVGAKIREEVFIDMVVRRELNYTVHIRT